MEQIWQCWQTFSKGKRRTPEYERFRYYLEQHLRGLQSDLIRGTYRHGSYRTFTVSDSKRRTIAVAALRDRFVHRLLYDALVPLYDRQFIYDVWSCREGKGLHAALERAQFFLRKYEQGFFWRADIEKFFDSVDHGVLLSLLQLRVRDEHMLRLLTHVIESYSSAGSFERERERESPTDLAKASPSATSRAKCLQISTCMNSIAS